MAHSSMWLKIKGQIGSQPVVELQEKKAKAQKMYRMIELVWGIIAVLLVPVHMLINFYYPENQGTMIGPIILLVGMVMMLVYFFKFYKIEIKLK